MRGDNMTIKSRLNKIGDKLNTHNTEPFTITFTEYGAADDGYTAARPYHDTINGRWLSKAEYHRLRDKTGIVHTISFNDIFNNAGDYDD